MRALRVIAASVALACLACGSPHAVPSESTIRAAMEAVRPLHSPLGLPQSDEWLASYDEPGQTFAQYLAADPVTPRGERRVLYVQPLGEFTPERRRIVALAAEFLGVFYNLPVRVREDLSLELVPASARRTRARRR